MASALSKLDTDEGVMLTYVNRNGMFVEVGVTHTESSLRDMLTLFDSFLKAIGYVVEGELEYVAPISTDIGGEDELS